ncbi:FAD-binding oxidoreductase [Shinella sp. CPCC 101442]|uniref:D-2-hydroxyglutarate dehydrogenase YdiJ n=1 Tax=Shinella sp. CPCC 101442 TaxID=2932265 RepID=UPI002153A5E9|nr:FAD-binding and (Fe-S)-binding domain-containing protein [Shinella sp. CPCC 101442]MCR6497537.1 FAD-binding oxidoreductase [Shinella sp. CPCC 101442]
MIPRLSAIPTASAPCDDFLHHLAGAGFEGDIAVSAADRNVFATDNSIYQVEPAGILFPKNIHDLKRIAKTLARAEFSGVTLAPRGGGTGTNGQSLTTGIVVDCSRHMNRILDIDPVRRIARVEAGVVKDQLNKALAPHGLFFAPELSTSNRATIGGMISTDACGQGSCLYGKTSNHVLGLRIVLTDGTDFLSRPVREEELRALQARGDRIGDIHRTLARIATVERAEIERIFPKLNRFMTGYDLAHLQRGDGRFDLNAVLCGSEGTLAIIAEAELNLLPLPAHAALVNIRYADFNAALEDARNLVALNVASVETIDETVLRLAKGDIIWPRIAPFFPDDADGPANGINIAEVLADTPEELADKLFAVTAALAGTPFPGRKGFTTTHGKAEIDAVWTMRKRAVGLLGNVDGPTRPVAFVEDTAVPPDNLAGYIREFRALLDGEGLSYGMFGHVDAGVLHVRPALDLTRPEHATLVRRISDAVVALTRKHGGVLWGEHGKGVRSEYVPEFFGPLYPCLQDIKTAFDPLGQLNPGKIVAPAGKALPKIDEIPLRGTLDRQIGNEIRAAFDNAAYCNGNGACFDFDADSQMCPSYKATGDRRHSPKGRASLMREWLRRLSEKGIDPRREAERQRRPLASLTLPLRAWNSLNPLNRNDFSHEVRAAMDTCLACKACAGQCPVKVSVPAFRAKFLELYYRRYLRPLKDPVVATIETMLPLMARLRPLYNRATASTVGKAALAFVGLTALPSLPARSARRELALRAVPVATPAALARLGEAERANAVIFVPDAFTEHFDPQVLLDAVEVARRLGLRPFVSPPFLNGKALHVHGYLGAFERTARRTAERLDKLAETNIPLVGLDPSMTLAYRGEYAGTRMRARVQLPQEWLASLFDRLPSLPGQAKRHLLMAHCTERTNAPTAVSQWSAVFARLGVDLTALDTGCCGMAGTFGHEMRNRDMSEKLYAMSWGPALARAGADAIVMATGYSCRSQVKLIADRHLPHPLQAILAILRENPGFSLSKGARYDM